MRPENGASRNRTGDLLGAIQALSHLSYSPAALSCGGTTAPERVTIVPTQVRSVPMGQLDDAIRDHLELLRRRGADPTEIARAEAEALSPAVREVAEPEVDDESNDLLAGTAPVPVAEDEGSLEDDSDPEDEPLDDDGLFDEGELEDEEDDGDELDDEIEAEAEAEVELSSVDQPTGLFDAFSEDSVAEEVAEDEEDFEDPVLHARDAAVEAELPEVGDGDVLEETPEFLSESPDHDKLWFEQSGPRDFDFDGDK